MKAIIISESYLELIREKLIADLSAAMVKRESEVMASARPVHTSPNSAATYLVVSAFEKIAKG